MEWKTVKLGDVASYAQAKSKQEKLVRADYISTENMLPNRGGVALAFSAIPESHTKFQPCDILISNIRPYFKKIWFADKYGGCSNDVLCVRGNERVISKYLYYLLSQDLFFDYVMAGSKGTKMPRGDKRQIMNFPIYLPPLTEQKRIATILSALDAKIENNNHINANLEAQAQALYKSWFVDFEPWDGKMPEDWKEGILTDVADITMGQSPKGESYNETGKGVVFYQGCSDFGERFPSVRMFTTEPTRYATPNSVLMSVRAPVGFINVALEECCIGRGLASIKSKHHCDSYILYLMQSLQKKLESYNGDGTVFGSINKKSLEGISIIVPTIDVIKRYNHKVSPFDEIIRNNTLESQRLAQLRGTLLPKLMKGEIEL